ncbi:hypothetical protein COCNU_15G004080 [Cocos nucifera]|uniref:Uncharacterized protein n=1 Tax=Cocos nucifera TaxID=13894 RepID=A0A8K0ND72_COCNU|nr:hypothetical protein COCNU_15G004080 [Cocos nucifera]
MVLFSVLAFLQVLVLIAIASVKEASRHGSDEDNCAEDVENQLGKEAKAEINPTPRQGYNGVHESIHDISRITEILMLVVVPWYDILVVVQHCSYD